MYRDDDSVVEAVESELARAHCSKMRCCHLIDRVRFACTCTVSASSSSCIRICYVYGGDCGVMVSQLQ